MLESKTLAALALGLLCSAELTAQRGTPSVRTTTQLPGPQLVLTGQPPASPDGARPKILLTGYWPPTNEMLRRFSDSATQNPSGWIGANWEGRGYDVHSYFPEFSPPNCSSCGRGTGDLEVDYQDTSADFWRIADALQPIAIITFSRGFNDMSWEVEMNQYNRATWVNDYVAPRQPTPAPPDASVPAGHLRTSKLPTQAIVDAVRNAGLGLNALICFSGDGGGFLSEFIAYHGVWYQSVHRSPTDPAWCIAGGHVHVGAQVSWPTATLAAQVTLREVIRHVDGVRANTICQQDIGFQGPGVSTLAVCGQRLTPTGRADVLLSDAAPNAPTLLVVGLQNNPTPLLGGHIVPVPALAVGALSTNASGEFFYEGLPGANGPAQLFLQFVTLDASQVQGYAISNAVRLAYP